MKSDVSDVDRDRAVLAAVLMAVRRFGIVPPATATATAESEVTDG
jgi:hypothetical protein